MRRITGHSWKKISKIYSLVQPNDCRKHLTDPNFFPLIRVWMITFKQHIYRSNFTLYIGPAASAKENTFLFSTFPPHFLCFFFLRTDIRLFFYYLLKYPTAFWLRRCTYCYQREYINIDNFQVYFHCTTRKHKPLLCLYKAGSHNWTSYI